MPHITTSTPPAREWDSIRLLHSKGIQDGFVTRVQTGKHYTITRIVPYKRSKYTLINTIKLYWVKLVDCFSW